MEEKIFYKRNLPHYQPANAIYFVTFRLANSLPQKVIEDLKQESRAKENEFTKIKNDTIRASKIYTQRKKYFGKFDSLLDGSTMDGMWLKDNKVAKIVSKALHFYDGNLYDLLAYTIMPNHVHLVLSLLNYVPRISNSSNRNGVSIYRLTKIMQSIKKYTARKANIALKRNGPFWHHESYDHVIRNENEFNNILNYVLQNPVKANLVKNWEDWRWNYWKKNQ